MDSFSIICMLQEAREGAAYESSVYTEDSTLEQKHHDVGEAYAEQVPLMRSI